MTRGQRSGFLTKAVLASRLSYHTKQPIDPTAYGAPHLLGAAEFHGLVSAQEWTETVGRDETTLPCYLYTHVTDAATRNALDRYVVACSELFFRGSLVVNYMAQRSCGVRLSGADNRQVPVERPRFDHEAHRFDITDLFFDVDGLERDVRSSAFKQVFLPERWPSAEAPRDPRVALELEEKAAQLPSLPDWLAVMSVSGWDNAINRMATKLWGNTQVHARCDIAKRAADYLRMAPFDPAVHRPDGYNYDGDNAARHALAMTLTGRLRPLTVSTGDWEMLGHLRRAIGVRDEDVTYYPPDKPDITRVLLDLHFFLTRYGCGSRSYLPVVSRGRQYVYVDGKILLGLRAQIVKDQKKSAASSAACSSQKSKASSAACSKQKPARAEGCDLAGPSDGHPPDTSIPPIGVLRGLDPDTFNRRRRALRKELRKKYGTAQRRETDGDKRRRLRMLEAKWWKRGSGRMRRGAHVDSIETDGVGMRLCMKTPIDMRPFIQELPSLDALKQARRDAARAKRDAKSGVTARALRTCSSSAHALGCGCDFGAVADTVNVGIDTGRAKLFTAAVQFAPDESPCTVTFTRHEYYYKMGYRRRAAWEAAQLERTPGLRAALDSLSAVTDAANGESACVRCCDVARVDAYLDAAKAHEGLLVNEYVVSKERALLKMRMFRAKKASLDRAVNRLMVATRECSGANKQLLFGVGAGGFPSTGRGELPAPTTSLSVAFARGIKREQLRGRTVHVFSVDEFRTTRQCAECEGDTEAPIVRRRNRDGGAFHGRSRRLRLCRACGHEEGGRLRDRDVQAARNILKLTVALYADQPRPMHRSTCLEGSQGVFRCRFATHGGIPTFAITT